MNHLKRITIITIGILFGVVFSCTAQYKKYEYKKRTAEEKARYFTKKMVDSLDVNSAQEDSLYLMNIIVSEKFDSLKEIATSLNRKDRSAAYRSIYAYRDSCMKVILPTKEFLKFLDFERERWERKKAIQKMKYKKEE